LFGGGKPESPSPIPIRRSLRHAAEPRSRPRRPRRSAMRGAVSPMRRCSRLDRSSWAPARMISASQRRRWRRRLRQGGGEGRHGAAAAGRRLMTPRRRAGFSRRARHRGQRRADRPGGPAFLHPAGSTTAAVRTEERRGRFRRAASGPRLEALDAEGRWLALRSSSDAIPPAKGATAKPSRSSSARVMPVCATSPSFVPEGIAAGTISRPRSPRDRAAESRRPDVFERLCVPACRKAASRLASR